MLDHPNIIRLEGAYFSQTKRTGSLFLEYCNGGSLFDLIRRHAQQRRPISELYVWYIFHQIALALEYLHSGAQQVLHLDIKPDNIFLQRDRSHGYGFVPKLADFGMSEVVPSGCPVSEIHYFNARYAPPEGVRVVAKSDVYMLGVTIESLMKLQGAYHGGGYSDELKRSVEACKSRDLRERPSAATLIRILDRRLNRIEPTLRGAERPLLR